MSFYELFKDVATVYSYKNAINNISYKELFKITNTNPYALVSKHNDYNVLIDILVASKYNKPVIIPPKDGVDFELPENLSDSFGIYLYTSGSSTGKRKPIFLSENMLLANASVAIKCQALTPEDIVFNVCSMNHTGGLNVQVIPGILLGSTVIIENFEPFTFNKRLKETNATITHLVPRMMNALRTVDKNNLRLMVAGSDCVSKQHIEFWLNKNIPFMLNYGMTEAGPVIINHIFTTQEELEVFEHGVPLGTLAHSDYMIQDSELSLFGNNICNEGWLLTGDCVEYKNGWFFYNGRKSAGCKIIAKRY